VDFVGAVQRDGYAIRPGVVDAGRVTALLEALERVRAGIAMQERGGPYAIRNLLEVVPETRGLAELPALRALVEPILGPQAFVARGLLFDKIPSANWKVPWHQDRTIAVCGRIEVPGFGPWSRKAGTLHVQPPVTILEQMLSLRVHLDDCDAENGPVLVLPGSHRQGRLSAEAIRAWKEKCAAVRCAVPRGGVLLMRPLLLHASQPARVPGHRRVIHLEFASAPLPGGLQWKEKRNG
jgi:hypothetical protein